MSLFKLKFFSFSFFEQAIIILLNSGKLPYCDFQMDLPTFCIILLIIRKCPYSLRVLLHFHLHNHRYPTHFSTLLLHIWKQIRDLLFHYVCFHRQLKSATISLKTAISYLEYFQMYIYLCVLRQIGFVYNPK